MVYKQFRDMARRHLINDKLDQAVKEYEKALEAAANSSFYERNKLLGELETVQNKKYFNSYPIAIDVTLTTSCNLNCRMCRCKDKSWQINEDTFRDIVKLIPYLKYINYLGGEVFLSKYFKRLLEASSRNPHINQTLTTNGLLINREWASILLAEQVEVVMSIDGFTKKTYEKVRIGAKFDDLIKRIKIFTEMRSKVKPEKRADLKLNFMLLKENYQEVKLAPGFAEKYGFNVINILPNNISGSIWSTFGGDIEMAREYYKDLLPLLKKESAKKGIKVFNMIPLSVERLRNKDSLSKYNKKYTREQVMSSLDFLPLHRLVIHPYGSVRLCMTGRIAGSIERASLYEIWNGSRMRKFRNNYYTRGLLSTSAVRCLKCFL